MKEILNILIPKLLWLFFIGLDVMYVTCLFQRLSTLDRQVAVTLIISLNSSFTTATTVLAKKIMVTCIVADIITIF